MSSESLTWEAPPPKVQGGSRPGAWSERLLACEERPGEWAKFGPYATAMASSGKFPMIRRAASRLGLPGAVEMTSRTIDGEAWLFMRYVPPEDAS